MLEVHSFIGDREITNEEKPNIFIKGPITLGIIASVNRRVNGDRQISTSENNFMDNVESQ